METRESKTQAKRFPIMAILALGSPSAYGFPVPGKEGLDGIAELMSFLTASSVQHFSVNYGWRSAGKKLREQFPKIDFGETERRASACLKKHGEYGYWYWDKNSKAYKEFVRQCECSFDKTRRVAQLTESEAHTIDQAIKNGGMEECFYNDGSVPDGYECSICGTRGVKLWRPYMSSSPLICANCAEKRQSARTYNPIERWEKNISPNGETYWSGAFQHKLGEDGKMVRVVLPMKKWIVDDEGKIPSADAPGPGGKRHRTDQLSIDLSKDFMSYTGGSTSIVPAIPNNEGLMWGYTSVPENGCTWWANLPTHKPE